MNATNRPLKNTASATKRTHTGTKAPALTVRPFTLPVAMVEITLQLAKLDADFLASCSQPIRQGIGEVVATFSARLHKLVPTAGRHPKGKTGPVSFTMESWEWNEVKTTAEKLNATTEEIARTAILHRIAQIREYRRIAAEKGIAAALNS